MVNITRFSKASGAVEFEVQQGSTVALRRGWESVDGVVRRFGGVLTLDEAREEQARLMAAGYRPAVLE